MHQQFPLNLVMWFDLESTEPIIRRIPLTCYFLNFKFPVVTSENILNYALGLCQAYDVLNKNIYHHHRSSSFASEQVFISYCMGILDQRTFNPL